MSGDTTNTHSLKQALLRDLLKRVSRLFYTTLVVVPADVRDQVSLAYLFARAADTIADTELIDPGAREAGIAIATLPPGSLQRMIRRLPGGV